MPQYIIEFLSTRDKNVYDKDSKWKESAMSKGKGKRKDFKNSLQALDFVKSRLNSRLNNSRRENRIDSDMTIAQVSKDTNLTFMRYRVRLRPDSSAR